MNAYEITKADYGHLQLSFFFLLCEQTTAKEKKNVVNHYV